MTTDRDDLSARRYREANAMLDERPSAATRAAILAAAARQVEAKPHAADAPRAAHRRRWPLAAAAAVLLSTLAVMVAQRTEQEMPTFTAPAEQSPAKVAAAPAEPPPTAEQPGRESQAARLAAPASDSAQPRAKNEVPAEPATRNKESAPTRAAGAPARPDSRVTESTAIPSPAIAADAAPPRGESAREQETASAEARRAFPAAPAAAPPPLAAEKPSAALSAAGSATNAATAEAPPAYRATRKELAPAPAAQGAVRQEAQRDVEGSAQEWLDRIVKLRGEGRHADADAELKRFRERYPDVRVPPGALPPAAPPGGTR